MNGAIDLTHKADAQRRIASYDRQARLAAKLGNDPLSAALELVAYEWYLIVASL